MPHLVAIFIHIHSKPGHWIHLPLWEWCTNLPDRSLSRDLSNRVICATSGHPPYQTTELLLFSGSSSHFCESLVFEWYDISLKFQLQLLLKSRGPILISRHHIQGKSASNSAVYSSLVFTAYLRVINFCSISDLTGSEKNLAKNTSENVSQETGLDKWLLCKPPCTCHS